jgi:hypothetical protein
MVDNINFVYDNPKMSAEKVSLDNLDENEQDLKRILKAAEDEFGILLKVKQKYKIDPISNAEILKDFDRKEISMKAKILSIGFKILTIRDQRVEIILKQHMEESESESESESDRLTKAEIHNVQTEENEYEDVQHLTKNCVKTDKTINQQSKCVSMKITDGVEIILSDDVIDDLVVDFVGDCKKSGSPINLSKLNKSDIKKNDSSYPDANTQSRKKATSESSESSKVSKKDVEDSDKIFSELWLKRTKTKVRPQVVFERKQHRDVRESNSESEQPLPYITLRTFLESKHKSEKEKAEMQKISKLDHDIILTCCNYKEKVESSIKVALENKLRQEYNQKCLLIGEQLKKEVRKNLVQLAELENNNDSLISSLNSKIYIYFQFKNGQMFKIEVNKTDFDENEIIKIIEPHIKGSEFGRFCTGFSYIDKKIPAPLCTVFYRACQTNYPDKLPNQPSSWVFKKLEPLPILAYISPIDSITDLNLV